MAVNNQKWFKAAGPDGVHMEACIYAGSRLFVHLSIPFEMFIKAGYVPAAFLKSISVPLVKCKTGDLITM